MNLRYLLCFAILGLLLAISSRADTIQPTSGPDIAGSVTKYANGSFEVRTADGKTRSYSSNSLKRIAFDARPIPVKVTSRTKGVMEGKVTVFENGGFTFEGSAGTESCRPSLLIESASVAIAVRPSIPSAKALR